MFVSLAFVEDGFHPVDEGADLVGEGGGVAVGGLRGLGQVLAEEAGGGLEVEGSTVMCDAYRITPHAGPLGEELGGGNGVGAVLVEDVDAVVSALSFGGWAKQHHRLAAWDGPGRFVHSLGEEAGVQGDYSGQLVPQLADAGGAGERVGWVQVGVMVDDAVAPLAGDAAAATEAAWCRLVTVWPWSVDGAGAAGLVVVAVDQAWAAPTVPPAGPLH